MAVFLKHDHRYLLVFLLFLFGVMLTDSSFNFPAISEASTRRKRSIAEIRTEQFNQVSAAFSPVQSDTRCFPQIIHVRQTLSGSPKAGDVRLGLGNESSVTAFGCNLVFAPSSVNHQIHGNLNFTCTSGTWSLTSSTCNQIYNDPCAGCACGCYSGDGGGDGSGDGGGGHSGDGHSGDGGGDGSSDSDGDGDGGDGDGDGDGDGGDGGGDGGGF